MSIEGQGHFSTIYFPDFVCFVHYYAKISGERLQDHWSSGTLTEGLEKNENIVNWVSKVKTLLQRTGFYYVWLFPDSVVLTKFISILKMRVRDQSINECNQKVSLSTSLQLYI